MLATIDEAGRLVIPKRLRDDVGLRPGEVEVIAEATGLGVEPLAAESLDERETRLAIPAAGRRSTTTSSGRFAMPAAARGADLLVDTSIAVAPTAADHEHHEATFRALGSRRLGVAGHAAFETLLGPHAAAAARAPHAGHGGPPTRGGLSPQQVPRCRRRGSPACRTPYDRDRRRRRLHALVRASAREHRIVLAPRDRRALETYRALDIRLEVTLRTIEMHLSSAYGKLTAGAGAPAESDGSRRITSETADALESIDLGVQRQG